MTTTLPVDAVTTQLVADGYRPADVRTAIDSLIVASDPGELRYLDDGLHLDDAQVGVLRDQLDRWRSAEPAGTLYDYDTAEPIRPATADELAASSYAAEHKDAGQGVIDVDGRRCYVLADA